MLDLKGWDKSRGASGKKILISKEFPSFNQLVGLCVKGAGGTPQQNGQHLHLFFLFLRGGSNSIKMHKSKYSLRTCQSFKQKKQYFTDYYAQTVLLTNRKQIMVSKDIHSIFLNWIPLWIVPQIRRHKLKIFSCEKLDLVLQNLLFPHLGHAKWSSSDFVYSFHKEKHHLISSRYTWYC